MTKIRIVASPPGQAPQWVRHEWVGLELPIVSEPGSGMQFGVMGGKPQNIAGFHVTQRDALEVLEKKSSKAANWWRRNLPPGFSGNLVFNRDICQVLD